MIPFINRTADAILSDHLDIHQVNVWEVIDEFRSQCDRFSQIFEAIVFLTPGRFRVTCKSSRKLENAENFGFVVRSFPVEFKPVSSCKWVNISSLSYGVHDVEISSVLEAYGRFREIKSEQYSNVYYWGASRLNGNPSGYSFPAPYC